MYPEQSVDALYYKSMTFWIMGGCCVMKRFHIIARLAITDS